MSGLSNGRSKSPLGRGLAALIPDDVMSPGLSAPRPEGGAREVALADITPNPEQPRTTFNKEALEELAASIREHGILNPLVVRPAAIGGRYILIAGERRLRAAGLAGLKQVPVVVRDDASDGAVQLELALVENLQRSDLNAIEEGRGYRRLAEQYGYTQADIARKVGKERSTVANAMRLLNHPDWLLDLVEKGRLSAGHARALLPVNDEVVLRQIVVEIQTSELSVRAAERLVKDQNRVKRTVQTVRQKEKVLNYANDLLTRALATRVEIRPRRAGGGRIMIDYHSNEDLERLIQHLRGDE